MKIVQLNESHKWFGCLLAVTEEKTWGVMGFIQTPEGQIWLRVPHEEYEAIGVSPFALAKDEEDDE